MKCECGGVIRKGNPDYYPEYAYQCDRCRNSYTWKEYRALQADKIIELVRKEESPTDHISEEYRTHNPNEKWPGKRMGD